MHATPDLRQSERGGTLLTRHPGRLGLWVLFVASLAVLSGVIPATLLASIPDVGRSQGWVLTLLIILWGGVRLSYAWVSGSPRLFDFFFWLYTYIFMGLGPTVQMRSGELSRTTPGMGAELDIRTAGVVVFGVACYELSRLVWLALERSRSARHRAPYVTNVSTLRTYILIAFGLLASAYFLIRVGGTASLGSRDAAFAARQAAFPDPAMRSVFYALAIYPLLVGTGALAQLRKSLPASLQRTAAAWMLAACLVLLLTIVNPIGSARYTFGTVAFAIAVYLGAMSTRLRARLTLLSTLLGFLFVFPIADAFRREEVQASRSSFYGEYLGNPDYDSFWQIANSILFVNDGYMIPLRQALGSIFFWVPRAVWADKPTDTGILLARYRGYDFENLSAPMWAEFLVNGGMLAVAIGFICLGATMRWMDSRLLPAFSRGGFWAVVGGVFPVYTTILLRGSLLQATGTLMVAIACVIFVRSADSGVRTSDTSQDDRRLPTRHPLPSGDSAPLRKAQEQEKLSP